MDPAMIPGLIKEIGGGLAAFLSLMMVLTH